MFLYFMCIYTHFEGKPLLELMYIVFTHMPGEGERVSVGELDHFVGVFT